jgi:hypothetical protein
MAAVGRKDVEKAAMMDLAGETRYQASDEENGYGTGVQRVMRADRVGCDDASVDDILFGHYDAATRVQKM